MNMASSSGVHPTHQPSVAPVSHSCRVCGSSGAFTTYLAKEMMFGTKDEFEYFLCASCGCLQIANIPDNLSPYYPANYYSLESKAQPPRHITRPPLRAMLERLRAQSAMFGRGYRISKLAAKVVDLPPETHAVGKYIKQCGIKSWNARFLDVGCGSRSWWLDSLRTVGFKHLFGIDPNIENSSDTNGISIAKSTLDKIAGPFDLITLHHSLEHMPDQQATLWFLKSLLAPNGHCLIRIPLVSSDLWDKYGLDWVELDAPRHLYLHSIDSIKMAASKVGLRCVDISWDSTLFDFAASEQYRRGISLVSEKSYLTSDAQCDFTLREMWEFSRLAAEANARGRGGRGCFLFQSTDQVGTSIA